MIRLSAPLAGLALGALLCAPAHALDVKSSVTPGAVPALTGPDALGDKELATNRADGKLFWKMPNGSLGTATLLNALPSGRKAVELGDGSDLLATPNAAGPAGSLGKWLASPALSTTDQLAQFSVSKVVSGAPTGNGTDCRYNGVCVGMIVDTMQPDDDASRFGFNGSPFAGVISTGVSTPARGSVAAFNGNVQVYDYADAPSQKVGGEPTGLAFVLNALTNKANGSQNYWGIDQAVLGPAKATAADREGMLVGHNLAIAKLSPGNAVETSVPLKYKLGSAGHSVQTAPGIGANFKTRAGDSWTGQTAYTIGYGNIVMGYGGAFGTVTNGDHASATEGFDVAYQSGGWGPAYLNPATGQPGKSKIGTAFKSLDHTAVAFRAATRHGVGTGKAFVADSDAGPSEFNSATTFGGDIAQSKATPIRTITATDAAAGSRVWRELVTGPSYLLQINDEAGTIATALQIDRTGGTPTKITPGAPIKDKSYTVASLPSCATLGAGTTAYASNGRRSGEGAGAGSGIPVYCDGANWRAYYDNSVAAQ